MTIPSDGLVIDKNTSTEIRRACRELEERGDVTITELPHEGRDEWLLVMPVAMPPVLVMEMHLPEQQIGE